ncbi:MAG: guanylate kinase [Deltaproteobacteria bacterium]|nr:MAG: guanylate kinase [Deltaproteobacteria bacterium]
MPEKGQIFVVTAPSGSGKTTLIDTARKNIEGVGYSISHTTRKPREGEVSGLHYYFIDRVEFENMIEAHEFVEWALVYGQLYGTSISSLNRELSSGKDLLMDVDVQGAEEIKRRFPESLSIFILPPSIEILRERLKRRSTDEDINIDLRMKKAVEEIQRCRDYDFIVVNDDLNQAAREIEAIITAQRACRNRRLPLVQKIFHI